MSNTEHWLARDAQILAPVLARVTDVVAVSGRGSWLTDVDGKHWLDLASGIGATNIGHCHPHVVAAITAQAADLIHTSVVTHHQRSIEAAERLGALMPFFVEPQVFFANSGAEVVDGALKLARRATGRGGVIAFAGAFHGRTLAATTLTTSKAKYREGYDPLLPGVRTVPFPRSAADVDAALAEFDASLNQGEPVGAVIVEPVQGEGGYVPAPPGFLAGLRARCRDHGVLLVFDEVQCGMGRTGRPFAAETFAVTPDVVLVAKGIASGLPLAAIVAEKTTFAAWTPGSHGSTFGGNPLSCAAAIATMDVLEQDELCRRAERLGQHALERLRSETQGNPVVADVRGIGLMIGIELRSGGVARAVQAVALAQGVIVLTCGPDDEVIRLVPALTIADRDLDLGIDVLVAAIDGQAVAAA